MTITLFDKNWKPLAERITYINNNEYTFQPEMEVTLGIEQTCEE
jgi:hypothetical protein